MTLLSSHPAANGLAALEASVQHDLARLNYPPANWVPITPGPDGAPMLDVLVIGAGMCGQTAAFALLREGVANLRIIDRNEPGLEGPWGTFARMETLRSPKHVPGPDLGIPSLTFRAWFEAQHGAEAWEALHKIPRLDWRDYLLWVRRMAAIPVENHTELVALSLHSDWVEATVSHNGEQEVIRTRKVVLALGREGSGAPRWPVFPSFDPNSTAARHRVFHSSDDIDFSPLRGKRVAVLGAGSSAFDNAATALESDASEVVMYARRPHLPQVNKSKWTSFPGFMRNFIALGDEQRWRFYTYIFDEQVPPPWESVQRCDRHAGFSIRFGQPWQDVVPDADGVTVHTATGAERFDAAIIATGFEVDLLERPEISAFQDAILTWGDRVDADEAARHPEAARFPYLGNGFELQERSPGAQPGLRHVHLFNWGSTMSHGALAGDIPGLAIGATRVAEGVSRALFVADADRLYQRMLDHAEPELQPTRYYVPPEERQKR